jgi:hypothetical protein
MFLGPVSFGLVGENVIIQFVFVQLGELLPFDPDGPSFVGKATVG